MYINKIKKLYGPTSLLYVGVHVEHVPVLHQGGIRYCHLEHPAGEKVREGVGIRAARKRTLLDQVEVAKIRPDPSTCPGPQGQEEGGLLPTHAFHVGEYFEAV